jgi:hypothetical protein
MGDLKMMEPVQALPPQGHVQRLSDDYTLKPPMGSANALSCSTCDDMAAALAPTTQL